jgi:glycosyltransferase involved in cell wall biosynthesis
MLDAKMVRCMSHVPVYAAETPLAVARVKRFLRMYRATPMPRVVSIPHPANTSQMRWLPGDKKENIVVAVGRWDDAVKGWPLLFAIAKRFLRIRPDWKIVVAGTKPLLTGKDRQEIEALDGRLQLVGHMDHSKLCEYNRKARIYLLTSHGETFNIAAAEALCCGCSVVGPSQIASVSYFAGWQSGTPSFKRSPDHMTDALIAEVDEWEEGRRDPSAISQAAIAHLSVDAVAHRYLHIFDQLRSGNVPG